MSETKWPKGPYHVVQPGNGWWRHMIYSSDYELLAFSEGKDGATADLFAAAPDLYEACAAFVEAWEKSLQLEKTDVALEKAKAAMAKATPKSRAL